MATRIDLSATGRADLRRIIAGRLRLPSDRRTLIWQIVTAPWWLWSDIPRLPLPVRDPDLPSGGLAGDWVVRGLDRIRTRLWTQWALVIGARSLVLALLIGCIWLLGELLGGPALDTRIWMLASSAVMLASVTIIVLSRPTRARTAYMLDRSFDLQERVSTALGNIGREIPTETGQASVIYLQVADAANAMTLAQEHPALRVRPPRASWCWRSRLRWRARRSLSRGAPVAVFPRPKPISSRNSYPLPSVSSNPPRLRHRRQRRMRSRCPT